MAQLAAQEYFIRNILDALYVVGTIGLFGTLVLFEYVARHSLDADAGQRLSAKLPKLALILAAYSLFVAMSIFFPGIAWLRAIDGIVGCAGIVAGLMLYRRLKAAAAR